MKRALLLLLAAGLFPPLLSVAIFYGYENWSGRAAWQRTEESLAAKGEPMSIEALRPKAIPDGDNLAAAPIFQQLFVFFSQRRTELYGLRLPPGAPALSTEKDSALTTLARRFQADFSGDANDAARVILAGLEPMKPLLDAIELAAKRPDAVWPVQYERGIAAPMPFLDPLRRTSEVLAARAVVSLAEREPSDAISDLELITRLARDVNQPPILAGSLAQQAMLGHAIDIVRDGLALGAWSDADLTRLQADLADFQLLNSFRESVRGERVLFLASPELVTKRAESLFRFIDFRSPFSEWLTSTLSWAVWNLRPSGWMNRDRATYSTLAQDWLSLVIHNDFVRPWALEDWNRRMIAMRRNPAEFFRTPVTAMALATFMPVARSAAYTQTSLDLARLACAIELCKRATGRVPGDLAELSPRWIAHIPRDAVTGGRYFYRPEGDSYLLYGRGWNARNDGGSSSGANAILGPSTADDWVWQTSPRWPQAATR